MENDCIICDIWAEKFTGMLSSSQLNKEKVDWNLLTYFFLFWFSLRFTML